MVLVNRNTVLDLPGLRPDDPDPGTQETDLRMLAIASAVAKMNEHEKTFLSQKTQGSLTPRGELTPRSVRSPRTHLSTPRLLHSSRSKRSGFDEHNTTVLNATVPFTNKNSAISNSYASPRQYTLSGCHMSRDGGMLESGKRPLRPLNGSSFGRRAFDYDEYEEIQLEQLKYHVPQPARLYLTKDVYNKACSVFGITPSQTYLKQLTEARDIQMANASLSHLAIKPIAISLVRDHRVHSLDVSGNDIGPLGVSYLAEMLKENDTVYELNLSGTNIGASGLEALAKVLEHNKSLHILRLESNYLDHTESSFLVDILKVAPYLLELYLGHNNLGYEGSKILSKELETNTTLRTLDVQWNHFRKDSAKVFCEALKLNKGLRCLNISWNGLGKEGCIALARALPKNKTLKDLDLTNNRIDVVALPFLLHGLVRNSALEYLKIGKNPMTTEGVKAVVRAITGAKNMAVRHLNIEDIPVDKEFTKLLKKMQESRSIDVEHGVEMYSAVDLKMREHDPHDLNRFDPVMVLIEYMRIDNLRLIDLFQFFDTDNMGLVSRENLRNGVATLGLPLTEHHLDCIMKDIDKKRDGCIDLEEFMIAQRDMAKIIIQRTTRAKGRGKEDLGLKELRKILKELVEKRNQRNKEKATKKLKEAFTGSVNKVKVMDKANKALQPSAIEREQTFQIPSIKLDTADNFDSPRHVSEESKTPKLQPFKLPAVFEPEPIMDYASFNELSIDKLIESAETANDTGVVAENEEEMESFDIEDGTVTLRDIVV